MHFDRGSSDVHIDILRNSTLPKRCELNSTILIWSQIAYSIYTGNSQPRPTKCSARCPSQSWHDHLFKHSLSGTGNPVFPANRCSGPLHCCLPDWGRDRSFSRDVYHFDRLPHSSYKGPEIPRTRASLDHSRRSSKYEDASLHWDSRFTDSVYRQTVRRLMAQVFVDHIHSASIIRYTTPVLSSRSNERLRI